MKRIVTVLLVCLISAAFGVSKAYDVVPYRGCVVETPWNTSGGFRGHNT
jgi:hypothetical protein